MNRLAPMILTIALVSCEDPKKKHNTIKENQAQERRINNSGTYRRDNTKHNVSALIGDAWKSGGNEESLIALRAKIEEIAGKRGLSPGQIAATIIDDPSPETTRDKNRLLMLAALDDVDSQVDLAKHLAAGINRSLVVSQICNTLNAKNDEPGLKKLHDALPVGKDRTTVSVYLTKMKVRNSGISSGLDFVLELDMPEERYSSMVEIESEWSPLIRDSEVRSRVNEIAKSFDGDFKEYFSLMISDAIRKSK